MIGELFSVYRDQGISDAVKIELLFALVEPVNHHFARNIAEPIVAILVASLNANDVRLRDGKFEKFLKGSRDIDTSVLSGHAVLKGGGMTMFQAEMLSSVMSKEPEETVFRVWREGDSVVCIGGKMSQPHYFEDRKEGKS